MLLRQTPQAGEVIIPGRCDWAYTAGIIAIVVGAAIVFFFVPQEGAGVATAC
jgi:hypothetical protein